MELDFSLKVGDNEGQLVMVGTFSNRDNLPLFIAAAVVLTAVLVWLAPAEATLGAAVKFVYLHAAVMWVGFGLMTLGAALGAGYWFSRRDSWIAWSYGSSMIGVCLLFLTGVLGILTAKITWGAVFWAEPRMAMLGEILLVGFAAAAVGRFGRSKLLTAGADVLLGGVAWVLVIRTERIIHPVSPIFSSDSAAIKIFPLLITAGVAVASVLTLKFLTSHDHN